MGLRSFFNASEGTYSPLETKVIIITIGVIVFFILAFLVWICISDYLYNSISTPAMDATQGVDPHMRQRMSSTTFSITTELPYNEEMCPLCLSEFTDGESLLILPSCNHVFHTDCIDIYMSNHPNCPCCRQLILVEM